MSRRLRRLSRPGMKITSIDSTLRSGDFEFISIFVRWGENFLGILCWVRISREIRLDIDYSKMLRTKWKNPRTSELSSSAWARLLRKLSSFHPIEFKFFQVRLLSQFELIANSLSKICENFIVFREFFLFFPAITHLTPQQELELITPQQESAPKRPILKFSYQNFEKVKIFNSRNRKNNV